MRAALCTDLGGPDALTLADLPEPAPGPGEVLIRVTAVALNYFDTLILRGKYQYKPELPFSPGGEVAGIIEALGPGVEDLRADERVIAYVKWNGCREKVAVPAADCIKIPDGVADDAAATLSIAHGTAMHGLADRGRLKAGETVAVLGATGGAGLAAVEIARLMGARVIALASAEKLPACLEHGADETLDIATPDLKDALKHITGGTGCDVIYDCVGGPYAEPALRSMAWRGRYLVVGFAGGGIPSIPLNLLLLKGCEMAGVFFGRFVELEPMAHRRNMEQVLAWCAAGRIVPRIHATFPLSRTGEALALIEARKVTGKLVVKPQPE